MEHTDPEYLKNGEYSAVNVVNRCNEIQETYTNHPQDWFEWIFDQIGPVPRARVLELGGGSGELWRRNMLRKGPAQWINSWEIYLSDLSTGMVTESRKNVGCDDFVKFSFLDVLNRNPGCPPYVSLAADVQSLPFRNKCFDMVVAIDLFDHVPNLKRAIEEIRRVLRPAGRLYASAGGLDHLEELEDVIKPYGPDALMGGDAERFGLENGARLLEPYFSRVTLSHYPGNLEFQGSRPVLEYALSEGIVNSEMTPQKMDALKTDLERVLTGKDRLRVRMRRGLFTAFNPVQTGTLNLR